MGFAELVLVTAPDSKFRSVADVLAYARQNPASSISAPKYRQHAEPGGGNFSNRWPESTRGGAVQASSGLIAAVRGNEIQVAFEFLAPSSS